MNWVSSWDTVGELTVTSADGDDYCAWDVPTDLEMARAELEALIER